MKKGCVLDASALLGDDIDLRAGGFFLCDSVRGEIIDENARIALDAAIKSGDVVVIEPTDESVKKVTEAAKRTGDISDLSLADTQSLALSHMMGIPIQTEDYAMQNVAQAMGIRWVAARQEGIKKVIIWTYRCSGCKKPMDGPGECFVCGHHAMRKAKKYQPNQ